VTQSKEDFWALIEATAPGDSAGTEAHVEAIEEALAAQSPEQIIRFGETLARLAAPLYTWNLWAVAYVAMGGCSDDAFDYFRMWVIAQGRSYYDAALTNPVRAADRIDEETEAECEGLDYVAMIAYEKTTGSPVSEPTTHTGAPESPAGEPFDEATVHLRFPELVARFGSG